MRTITSPPRRLPYRSRSRPGPGGLRSAREPAPARFGSAGQLLDGRFVHPSRLPASFPDRPSARYPATPAILRRASSAQRSPLGYRRPLQEPAAQVSFEGVCPANAPGHGSPVPLPAPIHDAGIFHPVPGRCDDAPGPDRVRPNDQASRRAAFRSGHSRAHRYSGLMANDAENNENPSTAVHAQRDGPSLPLAARQRIGHHLQNLYAPALREVLDERLVELLNRIDSAAAPKKPPADNDDSPLDGSWA